MIYVFDRDLAKGSNGIQLYGFSGREIREKTRTSGPFSPHFVQKMVINYLLACYEIRQSCVVSELRDSRRIAIDEIY